MPTCPHVPLTSDVCPLPSLPPAQACSSALVALLAARYNALAPEHVSSRTVPRGAECAKALTLAVNLMLTPCWHKYFARAGMLSPDGGCKTFDARANGYVRGEGVGAIVVGTSAADTCLGAVISSCAVRSDGKSASLTAPNGMAQQRMISAALVFGAVDSLSVIEAHGTGTPLGDPTEVCMCACACAHVRMCMCACAHVHVRMCACVPTSPPLHPTTPPSLLPSTP